MNISQCRNEGNIINTDNIFVILNYLNGLHLSVSPKVTSHIFTIFLQLKSEM